MNEPVTIVDDLGDGWVVVQFADTSATTPYGPGRFRMWREQITSEPLWEPHMKILKAWQRFKNPEAT